MNLTRLRSALDSIDSAEFSLNEADTLDLLDQLCAKMESAPHSPNEFPSAVLEQIIPSVFPNLRPEEEED